MRPKCLSDPCVSTVRRWDGSDEHIEHQYWVPEDGHDLLEAVTWLLSEYEKVELEYGESYGAPYCYLTCIPKQSPAAQE